MSLHSAGLPGRVKLTPDNALLSGVSFTGCSWKSSWCVQLETCLLYGNAVNAGLVATSFEGGGQVLVHDLAGHIVVDETAGHYKYVGIIVLTDEVSNLGDPAESGADTLMLVQSHGDTLSAAAHGYTLLYLSVLYATGQCMAVIGIVATIGSIGAVVLELQPLLLQVFYHELL